MNNASISTATAETASAAQRARGDAAPVLGPEHAKKIGILLFLCSEVAFFSTLIVAYILYMGTDTSGPTPEILSLPLVIVNSICLLSSSVTVVFAHRSLVRGATAAFGLWTLATVTLGALFLVGTGLEWYGLIEDHGLTISRNLFGSTFYTLIGFHGFHVTIGLICLTVMMLLGVFGRVTQTNAEGFEIVSWYWHFVDGVWIVIFTLVYVIGR